jgi:putative mRNA 3-end processing factor
MARASFEGVRNVSHDLDRSGNEMPPGSVANFLEVRDAGLYCAAGDFYVDPWAGVERAVITHAHGDHARAGSANYLCAESCAALLRAIVGPEAAIQSLPYRVPLTIGNASVSLYPAGHILGSAQIKIESAGYSWVVSGDYKLASDRTNEPFEPVRCHGFITEATFALPIFHWLPGAEVFQEIDAWWQNNRANRRASVLYCYSLGKAQRLLAGIDASIGPIYTHGAVERVTNLYRDAGVVLPPTIYAMEARVKDFTDALILAPPAVNGSAWVRRFGDFSTAMASGWMQIRGHRRRRAIDRGFVLSDHADWPGLFTAIRETGAEQVWVTHGYVDPFVRWLREKGFDAQGLATHFENEDESGADPEPEKKI